MTHSLGCRSHGGRSTWLAHYTHSEEQKHKCLCLSQCRVPAHGMVLVTFKAGGGVSSQMKPILEVPHGPLRALSLRRFKSVPLTATAFFIRVARGGNSTKCFPKPAHFILTPTLHSGSSRPGQKGTQVPREGSRSHRWSAAQLRFGLNAHF